MNENKIKISVIMSTKDTDEAMLRDSIESILNQTYTNFEFIIVCDGSEANYKVLKEYTDERIKLIIHDSPKGLPYSLNEAMEIATGDYIARMDSDDISLPNRLEVQLEFMEKNCNIDICSTFVKCIGNKKGYMISAFNKPEQIKSQLFIYNNIIHPTIMMRKSFITKFNIKYDHNFRYSQDYELWTRCSELTDFYIIERVCLYYRVHDNQISTAKMTEQNSLCESIYVRNLEAIGYKNIEQGVRYLFYLSGKSKEKIKISEIIIFINDVIKCNENSNIYNAKYLYDVLVFAFFKAAIRNNKTIIPIREILRGHFFTYIIKRQYLMSKCIRYMKGYKEVKNEISV